MDVDELIARSKNKNNTNKEWLDLLRDIDEFLMSDEDEKDKRKLGPLGPAEKVYMICDAINKGLL